MSISVSLQTRWLALLLVIAGALACGGGETRTIVEPPGGGGGGGGGGGNASLATLTVAVRPSTDDAGVFGALGWANGVPGATVVIQRTGSSVPIPATTDAAGVATFPGLVPGTYSVSALRTLTATERGALGTGNNGVDAAAGATERAVTVAAPSAAIQLPAFAGRRGSLVVSEIYRDSPALSSGEFYRFSKYLELYNNADTAITLADKVIGEGFPGVSESPNYSCSDYEFIYNDPAGVWLVDAWAFPPSARVLQPGEAVVLATDAIDHTQLAPGKSFDLSSAGFEFTGGADNPSVPDMVPLGPNGSAGVYGRGLEWFQTAEVVVVANAVDIAAQSQQLIPRSSSRKMLRYPAAALLDVIVDRVILSEPRTPCPRVVNAAFDRQPANLRVPLSVTSIRRRVIGTLPDGRKVLLRTKTTSRDFELGRPPTPFRVP